MKEQMHATTRRSLLRKSFPTDLINKIGSLGHTVAYLQAMPDQEMAKNYSIGECKVIREKLVREPIEEEVLDRVIESCGESCAYCEDGNSSRPYQIHHIELYSNTQDNSEDNLFLLCPTHHVTVHTNKFSIEDQKAKRRSWHALVQIAIEYKRRNIGFPFGAFEAIDYIEISVVTDIFKLGAVPPSLATRLATYSLADRALGILSGQNSLLVMGSSGSGKSTLALGIAGRLVASEKLKAFKYRRNQMGQSRMATSEILSFMEIAKDNCILILDDADTWATDEDLQKILAAASKKVRVVITCAKAGTSSSSRIEFLFSDRTITLTWSALQQPIFSFLMENEKDVVIELSKIRGSSGNINNVGLDYMSHSLETHINEAARGALTVQQFIASLCARWRDLDNVVQGLISDGRADIPVIYAAIEQIADVERAINLKEAVETSINYGPSTNLPLATELWVESIFSGLVNRRLFVKVRESYTTFHRHCALQLIGSALTNPLSRGAVEGLLERDFCSTPTSVRRLMFLWSWFLPESKTRPFLNSWLNKQSVADWTELVRSAARSGLGDLALVFEHLHLLFDRPSWTADLGGIIESNKTVIIDAVRSTTPTDWYRLSKIFMALNHANEACAAKIVQAWPPLDAAKALEDADPVYYDSITWFLNGPNVHSPAWCKSVGKNIRWEKIEKSLDRLQPGSVDDVYKLFKILRLVQYPIRRSQLSRLVDFAQLAMSKAKLREIDGLPIELPPILHAFPTELRRILSGIDLDKFAKELSISIPKFWRTASGLGTLSGWAQSDFAERVVCKLGDDFLDNVKSFARSYAYEYRVLLWFLCHGSEERRKFFATELYHVTQKSCEENPHEKEFILKAMATLHLPIAKALSVHLGLPCPDPRRDEIGKPVLDWTDELITSIQALESSGEDYILSEKFPSLT